MSNSMDNIAIDDSLINATSTNNIQSNNELTPHAVIQCRQLTKTFRDGEKEIAVLRNVNFQIHSEEMVAIIGASGSGKSTLLHVLGGLDSPDSGEVFIQNTNIHQLSAKKQGLLRNKALGFVYQFHHLLAEFSALENVAMPLLIGGSAQKEAYDKAESMLQKVGLKERVTHKPAKLSGGERQRVAIARAMVTHPACILADEPTGNLDMGTAQSINELMFELNATEKTSFLIVSHDMKLAESMQKTYQMIDGQLDLVKE